MLLLALKFESEFELESLLELPLMWLLAFVLELPLMWLLAFV